MGILKHLASGKSVVLSLHAVAGRAPSCSVHLADPAASNDHASVAWVDEHWEVRDLGSTNGTLVRGVRVPPGVCVRVERGAVLQFGSGSESWELIDDGEPVVMARSLDDGEIRRAEDGLLALPASEEVFVTVVRDADERWFVETADGLRRPASDGEQLTVAGRRWALAVPPTSPIVGTRKASAGLSLATLTLRFHVSRDEEHVRVELLDGVRVLPLKERTGFYVLLELARERQEDARAGVAEGEQGWVDVEGLTDSLKITQGNLNVLILRVRQAFAKAGVAGAEHVVERRSKQLRIGTGRLEVGKAMG